MAQQEETRVKGLLPRERERLDNIASRHLEIQKGTANTDTLSLGRLQADVSHLLRIIGGKYARAAERL